MSAIAFFNPFTTEVKTSVDYGNDTLLDQCCTTSFDRVSDKLMLMLKIVTTKDRTHAARVPFYHLTTMPAELSSN